MNQYLIIGIIYLFNIKIGIVITILYLLFMYLNKHKPINNTINKNCRKPTLNNPYANYNLNEDGNIETCLSDNNNKLMDEYNLINVYENTYNKNTSLKTIGSTNKALRDFYTLSSTSYPNKINDFAIWTYKNTNLSCKEDNNCLQYDDIRYHSR